MYISKKNRLNVFLYIKPWTVSEMLRTNENKCWWCCFLLRETGYESYFHWSKTLTEILQSFAYGIASMLFFYQSNDWLCHYIMSAVKLIFNCRQNWRSMIAICFGIYLYFTMSSMLCVHGLRVIRNKHFEPTLLFSNIRLILFEFRDLQYIQYNMELRYILILAMTRKTTLES